MEVLKCGNTLVAMNVRSNTGASCCSMTSFLVFLGMFTYFFLNFSPENSQLGDLKNKKNYVNEQGC